MYVLSVYKNEEWCLFPWGFDTYRLALDHAWLYLVEYEEIKIIGPTDATLAHLKAE